MSEIERVLEECLECGICMEDCTFLSRYCDNPRHLAEIFQDDLEVKPQIPYLCNLCGYCATVCPESLDIGKMCLEARHELMKNGAAPAGPMKFVRHEQDFVFSDSFQLTVPNPEKKQVNAMFFPGCHLAGYSPELVMETYAWLQERMPGVGMMLQCCGAPTVDIGDDEAFQLRLQELCAKLLESGGQELIVACPNCYHHFKKYTPAIKIISLYEVMLDVWDGEIKPQLDGRYSLHDPCKARWEDGMQDSVRKLGDELGLIIDELDFNGEATHCCGMGGMVPYVSMAFAGELAQARSAEARHDVLTYCASCREALAPHKPAVHILDLIFGTDVDAAKSRSAHRPPQSRANQARLKEEVVEKYASQL